MFKSSFSNDIVLSKLSSRIDYWFLKNWLNWIWLKIFIGEREFKDTGCKEWHIGNFPFNHVEFQVRTWQGETWPVATKVNKYMLETISKMWKYLLAWIKQNWDSCITLWLNQTKQVWCLKLNMTEWIAKNVICEVFPTSQTLRLLPCLPSRWSS